MPPRYAYWTIIVDNQPTAFRAGAKEDLLPTFNRLKQKDASATMMWFQNGKLWPSRLDAQEAMLARGEMGRRGDERQAGLPAGARSAKVGGFRDRERRPAARSDWKPKTSAFAKAPADKQDPGPRTSAEKLDWKPKGEFTPAPKRSERPDWKPKTWYNRDRKPKSFARPEWKPSGDDTRSAKPAWKPKGSFTRESKPDWKPKTHDARPRNARSEKPDWKPKGSFNRDRKPDWKSKTPEWRPKTQDSRPTTSRSEKLEWKPKGEASSREKRKWVPKAEYKKSLGIEAKRDSKWRPGGEHRDPKQKYKDAKKAKWTKFKKTIRTKWESKKKP